MYFAAARSLRAARSVLIHRTEKSSRAEKRFGGGVRVNANNTSLVPISSSTSNAGNNAAETNVDATLFAPGSSIVSNFYFSGTNNASHIATTVNTKSDKGVHTNISDATAKSSSTSLFLTRRFSVDTNSKFSQDQEMTASARVETPVETVDRTTRNKESKFYSFIDNEAAREAFWDDNHSSRVASTFSRRASQTPAVSSNTLTLEEDILTEGELNEKEWNKNEMEEQSSDAITEEEKELTYVDSLDNFEGSSNANMSLIRQRQKFPTEYLNQQKEVREILRQELLDSIHRTHAQEGLEYMFTIWEESFSNVALDTTTMTHNKENATSSVDRFKSSVIQLDKHVSPRPWLYDVALFQCFQIENIVLVEYILHWMYKFGVTIRPRWFSQLINLYSKQENLKSAFGVLDTMSVWGIVPDSFVYSALLQACVRCSRFELALKVHDYLQEEGYVMDAHMYSTLVNGAGALGDLETAGELLKQAKEHNVELDTALCNTFLVSCAKHHDVSRALQLFKEMEQGIMGQLALPNDRTYNILINLFCKMNPPQVDRALCLVEEQRTRGFSSDESTFCPIIDAYFRLNDPYNAVELFKKLRSDNTVTLTRVTYDTVINGLGRAGFIDDAFEVFRIRAAETSLESLDDTTYNNLLNAFIENNRLEEAERFFQESLALGFKPSTATFNIRLKGLLSQGNLMQGFRLVEEMVAQNVQPTLITFNTLLDIALRGQHYAYVDSIVKAIEKRRLKPDIYTFNLRLQATYRLGEFTKAEAIYSEMLSQKLRPDVYTFVYLMACAGRRNDTTRGMQYLREAMSKGKQPKGPIAYRPLLHSALRNGKTEDVLTLVRAMQSVSLYLDEKLRMRFISWCRMHQMDPTQYLLSSI
eukprot:jgi/Galph1/1470/GphlegSOOS_G152.1